MSYAAVLVVLVAACGGGKGDEEAVTDAVRGYLDAAAQRDGARACGYLTRRAQLGVFELGRVHAAPDHPEQACASVFETYVPLTGRERVRDAPVSGVSVAGDRARARAGGVPVRLRKTSGEWKLDVAGVADRLRGAQSKGAPG